MNRENEQVVITGMGAVSPMGHGVEPLWQALVSGQSGIRKITKFDSTDFSVHIGGEIPDFDPAQLDIPGRKPPYHMDEACLYGILAAREALEQSGLDLESVSERLGAVVATGIGGIGTTETQMYNKFSKGPRRVGPRTVPMLMPNAVVGNISIIFGIKGPTYSVASACASSIHAVINAAQMIKLGEADAVLTGGAEACLTEFCIAGFSNMKALSKSFPEEPHRCSRPFDAKRDGFVMGEGAGLLVLESLSHAQKRGATVLARLAGYGASSDAGDIVAPDPTGAGAFRALELAFRRAGLNPEECAQKTYVNAHGTSTPLGDRAETMALKKIFGNSCKDIRISSSKSMTGHLIGAAGGIESAVCIKTLIEGVASPTINLENPDPECDLNYVPNKSEKRDFQYAVNDSFGFGGHNGVLIFEKV